jgi:hypothetical protein
MEWITFWTAFGVLTGFLVLIGGLYAFIRRLDMNRVEEEIAKLEKRLSSQELSTASKLDEDEFRRYEIRAEKLFHDIKDSSMDRMDKLETKIDNGFTKLYDLLISNRPN